MSTTIRSILLVEDNEDDAFLMERALEHAGIINPIMIVENGQEAVDYLSGQGKFSDRQKYPLPVLIFLDLKLPIKNGFEVLQWVRDQPEFESIQVVVLTSSNEPSDLSKSYDLGANSYVVKPPTAAQLMDMAKAFKWAWLSFKLKDR
jgi:CheY-like chemotaxis protein